MGQPSYLVGGALITAIFLIGCEEESKIGPGTPCGDPPTAIEALPMEGLRSQGIPDQLDVSACVEGRLVETLPLGSAWVEMRRVNGCCEVWLGGHTEDPSQSASPHQFCRFSRSTGERVPIYVGRQQSSEINSAGPARVCEDAEACTVGLEPTYSCSVSE